MPDGKLLRFDSKAAVSAQSLVEMAYTATRSERVEVSCNRNWCSRIRDPQSHLARQTAASSQWTRQTVGHPMFRCATGQPRAPVTTCWGSFCWRPAPVLKLIDAGQSSAYSRPLRCCRPDRAGRTAARPRVSQRARRARPVAGETPGGVHRVHICSKIGVIELAALTQLSIGHFFRAFKVSFGASPLAYVMRQRMLRAQKIMTSSAAPLSRIALECGMCDQAHFSHTFGASSGSVPTSGGARFPPVGGLRPARIHSRLPPSQ